MSIPELELYNAQRRARYRTSPEIREKAKKRRYKVWLREKKSNKGEAKWREDIAAESIATLIANGWTCGRIELAVGVPRRTLHDWRYRKATPWPRQTAKIVRLNKLALEVSKNDDKKYWEEWE